MKPLTKILAIGWGLSLLICAAAVLSASTTTAPVVFSLGDESALESLTEGILILIPAATALLTAASILVELIDMALDVPGALEIWRQTKTTRRLPKGLPIISRRERLRAVWEFLRGRQPLNFDALPVRVGFHEVPVDHRLAPLVSGLNAQGIHTVACCQGWLTDEDPRISRRTGLHACQTAYLKIGAEDEFPDELIQAVVGSKTLLEIGHQRIQTIAAYQEQVELYAANEMFFVLLEDWLDGTIDASGRKYRELHTTLVREMTDGRLQTESPGAALGRKEDHAA